jgi:hypothetical protein
VKAQKADIIRVIDRLWQRDRPRFRKLFPWLHTARRKGWTDARIYKALLALDAREAKGQGIDDWWPWLNAALEKVRTLELQAENDQHKREHPQSLKAILRHMMIEAHSSAPPPKTGAGHGFKQPE